MTCARYDLAAVSCATPFRKLRSWQSHKAYIRQIFNRMADEYDHLRDLWYPHTFGFPASGLS